MSGSKEMMDYNMEIKVQIVHLHEQDGLSYFQIAEQLRIRKAERIEK